MDNNNQSESDLSWMSFTPKAHGITNPSTGWSNRRHSERDDEQRSWNEDRERRSTIPTIPNYETEEEGEQEDELPRRRKKERGRKGDEDENERFFSKPASTPSYTLPPPVAARPVQIHWDGQGRASYSSRSRGTGFVVQRENWRSTEEEIVEDKSVMRVSQTRKFYQRIQSASGVVLFGGVVTMLMMLFLLYLSFGAVPRPPSSCEVDKVILDFTARRIRLRGGRYISFREEGVLAEKAQHSVIVVHDLVSSRLAGIPGISGSLLEEFGVRLVSYDRPGYGQSDSHPGRSYKSSALDMADIADALGMSDRFWLIAFGSGGPHVWAAINYIPERLAGVALLAPAGNFYSPGMSKDVLGKTWGVLTMRQKWLYAVARLFPALLPSLLQKTLVNNIPNPLQLLQATLGSKDHVVMEKPEVSEFWKEDVTEALQQQCAFPMAEELILMVRYWGFSLTSLPFKEPESKTLMQQVFGLFQPKEKPRTYSGPIHIWQGTDDQFVPAAINEYAMRQIYDSGLPDSIAPNFILHLLEGEGHISWFWFCSECHQNIFQTLFKPEPMGVIPIDHEEYSAEEYELIFGGTKHSRLSLAP